LSVEPDAVITHAESGSVVQQFRDSGADYIWNPNKVIVSLDYGMSESGPNGSSQFQGTREFLRRQRVKHLYDLRDGLCHQVVIEKGHALPGQLIVGSDHQAVAYGSVGALGTSCDLKEIASVWAHGHLTVTVPDSVRVSISGRRGKAIAARDIMLALYRDLPKEMVAGKAIEFGGSIITQMTQSERLSVAALSSELEVAGALLPYDATTRRYLTGRHSTTYKPVIPDKNAEYSDLIQITMDHVGPLIHCPSGPDRIKSVAELDGTPVHLIIVGSLSSGRFDDLRVVAEILKGKQVHGDCRLIVMPASRSVYLEALNKGLVRVLVEAGAVITASGNSGMHAFGGSLSQGERCLSTTCSNLPLLAKMTKADIFYCSPATAAASSLHAAITDPTRFIR
jgi:3-isopropylmalate/(R)-2-methylmalate dehydratase large subunit